MIVICHNKMAIAPGSNQAIRLGHTFHLGIEFFKIEPVQGRSNRNEIHGLISRGRNFLQAQLAIFDIRHWCGFLDLRFAGIGCDDTFEMFGEIA